LRLGNGCLLVQKATRGKGTRGETGESMSRFKKHQNRGKGTGTVPIPELPHKGGGVPI